MRRRPAGILRRCSTTAAAAGLVLAGCTAPTSSTTGVSALAAPASSTAAATGRPPGAAPRPTAVVSTAPVSTAPVSTVPVSTAPVSTARINTVPVSTLTRTRPGGTVTVTVLPPPATAEPAPVDGDCPYLDADAVSGITGQHHGRTQLIRLDPYPMCVFYRSDGDGLGCVRVIQAASAAAAAAAVDQHVPIAGSQPASVPAGWSGGSRTSPGQMTQDSQAQSMYAVSKGTVAVVAEENESPSLKARLMAVCAIYGLGLEQGPAPAYCTGPER